MIWSPIMAEVRLQAHAKINLALALAAPEPPGSVRAGWHRICTWMHAIDLADEVYLEPLPEGGGSTWSASWAPDTPRPGLLDWPCEQDLAWRALRAIEEHLGRRLPTRIVLTKRIPTGSGLGGGLCRRSSHAARDRPRVGTRARARHARHARHRAGQRCPLLPRQPVPAEAGRRQRLWRNHRTHQPHRGRSPPPHAGVRVPDRKGLRGL